MITRQLNKLVLILGLFSCPLMATPLIKGVSLHVIDNTQEQEKQLDICKKIGFNSVRDDAHWSQVETTKGNYKIPSSWDNFVNLAVERNIQPILILDYGNKFYDNGGKPRTKEGIEGFVNFAKVVVRHFKGRVNYYEIWNEWDGAIGAPPGSPDEYAKLFKATYPELKKISPQIKIISAAGLKDPEWIENLASNGVVNIADGVAVHPYNYPTPGNDGSVIYSKFLQDLHTKAVKLSGRKNVDFYITEIGWPTHSGQWQRSENDIATLSGQTFKISSQIPFIKGVWWYSLIDGKNPHKNRDFGLLRHDYSTKPAVEEITKTLRTIK